MEQNIHVNLTTQLVLSKLVRFNNLDRGVDSNDSNHEHFFQSFFNQVIFLFCFKLVEF